MNSVDDICVEHGVLSWAMPTAKRKLRDPPSGKLLAESRALVGMTQQTAADVLDVPIGTLQQWEQGRYDLPPQMFELFQLRTGQFKVSRWEAPAKAFEKGSLHLRLASGDPVTVTMRQEAFEELARAIARMAGV